MSIDFKKFHDELLFVPLGGSNEIGMNLNLYHSNGKWLMVDCGIGFAGEYLPGVEVMVPDISFIVERKKDLLGLVLTHAHEDHLGAVPYLWRELECPIYATPFTAAFLRHKVSEMAPGKKPVVHEVKTGAKIDLAPFALEMLELTHSIPEMQAIAITTPQGIVMHTGDWKFDEAPLIGPASDYTGLKRYGDGNVLAMVCDSTNVFVEGEAGSEGMVREHLTKAIQACPQRVIVTTFASNLARVATIIDAADKAGRMIALAGRSLWRVVEAAKESGYLRQDIELLSDSEIMSLPRKDALILCTGSQGEPRAALTRIARGDHPNIRLNPQDTVIFSSRKIPGNETRINWILNRLVERGVEVITDKNDTIHVSGHPAREELKRMYAMVRPKIAVPTHGEARHLHEHAKLARSLGVKETVEAKNGAVIWLAEGEASILGHVESGYLGVDGVSLIPVDGDVIRTRRKMRDDGAVFISIMLGDRGELAAPPELSYPGILDSAIDGELMEEIEAEITSALSKPARGGMGAVRDQVRTLVRKILKNELDKKPIIEVHVVQIG